MFHLLIRGCTNAFQLHITEMKLHSFTVFSTRLCLNPQQYHNINTGASPVCICVCVCVHVCIFLIYHSDVYPKQRYNRIGRTDNGSKFCVQSPLEPTSKKKRATKTKQTKKIHKCFLGGFF